MQVAGERVSVGDAADDVVVNAVGKHRKERARFPRGVVGRDVARGPGFVATDLAVLKDTKVRESMNLQFRAEFFNLFNRANFGLPVAPPYNGGGVGNSQFGKITLTVGTPRQGQLAFRLTF